MVVLALLAVGFGYALHSLSAKAKVAQAQMDALKAKTQRYLQERQANEARMRQPQNMAVLERSRFLNERFEEKSFSWTAVMMDLEKVLPVSVQVTSIDPAITKEGDVNIRLRVSGDRDKAVQLVRNLETSQRFLSPRLASEQAQTQEGNRNAAQLTVPGAVQFDVLSGYNPLPEKSTKDVATKSKHGVTESDSSADGVKKKRAPKNAPTSGPKTGVKAPAQKGAAR